MRSSVIYVDKPQGVVGQLARLCTGMSIEWPNRFFATGHALVRPRGTGRSWSG